MLPASVTAVGKQVAGREAPMPRWSASSSWQRRPCGPSATLTDSRPSRGMPLSCQKLRPEHSDAACGDSVIVSEAACGACDSDARACVQHHPSPPTRPPRLRRLRYVLHAGGWYAGALTHGAQRSLVTGGTCQRSEASSSRLIWATRAAAGSVSSSGE